jgi:hypothetical protein
MSEETELATRAGLDAGILAGYAAAMAMLPLKGGRLAPDPLPGHVAPPHGTYTPALIRSMVSDAVRKGVAPLWIPEEELEKLVKYVLAAMTFEGVSLDQLNEHLRRI